MHDLAATGRRLLVSGHTSGGHPGELHDCPDCVADAFRIHMFGGIAAPGRPRRMSGFGQG